MDKDKEAENNKKMPPKWLQGIRWCICWARLFLFGIPKSELMQHAKAGSLRMADSPKIPAPDQEWLPQDLDTELQCMVLLDTLR